MRRDYNYRLASMLENAKPFEFAEHVIWLFRLEIITIVDGV